MYDYEYDDYFEPGEFDEEIERMKEALRKSVKKEIQDELESLRKENKKLKGIKEHFEQIKNDYKRKEEECDRAIATATQNAMRVRLSEVLERNKLVLWSPNTKYQYKKKCDKCDIYRRIKVILPSGNTALDKCLCDVSELIAYPEKYIMYEISDRNNGIIAWYKKYGDKYDEYFTIDSASYVPKTMIDHNKKFEDIPKDTKVFFTTYEECLSYCQYLTPNFIEQGFVYKTDGTLIENKCEEKW